ncbi:MAG: radical SAM protein [Sedimentisphaerales bacterium]|nr:radical SAM protein [Sedimentisphaerales bacterium]
MAAQQIPKPALVAFELTGRCKYNCIHCRLPAAGPDQEPDTSTCLRIISAVARYCRCTMILTGGEPMARQDLSELIHAGSQMGLNMVMATCGEGLDQKAASRLKAAGLRVLAFSIDGPDPRTHDRFRGIDGAFDTILKASKSARDAGLPFQINTTVTRLNAPYLLDIARLARDLGAICFNVFILVPTGKGKQIQDQVLDPDAYESTLRLIARIPSMLGIAARVTCGPQLVRVLAEAGNQQHDIQAHGCMGGIRFAFIGRTGAVQACGFLDLPAGNLVEENFDFRRIWEGSQLFTALRDRAKISGHCRTCRYLYACSGCRARAYTLCGDYLASDPICKGPDPIQP